MRQVVDELGADPLEAAQLGDVLEHEPDAEDRRASRPHDEGSAGLSPEAARALARPRPGRAIADVVAQRHLAARPAGLAGALGDGLDPMVAERLDRGSAEHRAAVPAQEHVRGGVGDLDAQIVVQADDPDPDQVGQVGEVAEPLLEPELGRLRPAAQPPQSIAQVLVGGAGGGPHGSRRVGLAQGLVDRPRSFGHATRRPRARSRGRSPGAPRNR